MCSLVSFFPAHLVLCANQLLYVLSYFEVLLVCCSRINFLCSPSHLRLTSPCVYVLSSLLVHAHVFPVLCVVLSRGYLDQLFW